MNSPLVIKDPELLLKTMKRLKPASSRLFLFLLLTKKPLVPFVITYNKVGHLSGVKNPYLAMRDLIDAGLITRVNPSEYQINLDITEGFYAA